MSSDQIIKQADISCLRIMSTLAVILLHTCNTITNNASDYIFIGNQYEVLTSIVRCLNWAVPVFFMISGSLLINSKKEINYVSIIRKYCRRILLALIIFGIPFSMMEIFFDTRTLSFSMFFQACLNVLTGNSWGHLWYLYVLIGLYLMLPVINAFFTKADRKTCVVFSILLFIFCFLVPVINDWFDIEIAFEMPIASKPLFYLFIGKLLYTSDKEILSTKYVWGGGLILLLLVSIFFGDGIYNNLAISGISICIFLLFKGIKIEVSKLMWAADRLCFGVYLIHPLLTNFVYKFLKVTPLNFGDAYVVGVVIMWILFVIVGFFTSYVMNLIKPLKKYVL